MHDAGASCYKLTAYFCVSPITISFPAAALAGSLTLSHAAQAQGDASSLGLSEQQLREKKASSYTTWRDSLTEKGGRCVIADGKKMGADGKRSGVIFYYYFLKGCVYKIQSTGTYRNYGLLAQQAYETSPYKENINTWLDIDHHYRYRLATDEPQNTATLTVTDSRTDF